MLLELPWEKHTRRLRAGSVQVGSKNIPQYIDVTFTPTIRDRFELSYPFSKAFNEDVRSMGHAHWHGFDAHPRKVWSVKNDQRTAFVVQYLDKSLPNPYDWFKQPIKQAPIFRDSFYQVQLDMINAGYTYRYYEFACEMGLGKTLSAIHIIEMLEREAGESARIFWVSSRSALDAAKAEFKKWKADIDPELMTYQGLTDRMNRWRDGQKAPRILILDESTHVKNMDANMTLAAYACANGIRKDWGRDGCVILMTGTPAPKSPVDWWAQTEIIQPGFLKEADKKKFLRRLAIMQSDKNQYDNVFEKRKTWRDDPNKCDVCGEPREDFDHTFDHKFVPSKNEIQLLSKRLDLVRMVRLKSECTDLPQMRYEVIRIIPDDKTRRLSALLDKRATSAMARAVLKRTLSDGFVYEKEECGTLICPVCNGKKEVLTPVTKKEPTTDQSAGEIFVICPLCEGDANECEMCNGTGYINQAAGRNEDYDFEMLPCTTCTDGYIPKYKRVINEVKCPKDAVLLSLLERHKESGRFVTYAGFQGSVDRVVKICLKADWHVVRVDGRGIKFYAPKDTWTYGSDYLDLFQDPDSPIERFVFAGQSEAGGEGITLTRSSGVAFFSNTHKGGARAQAEARIHRFGMDMNLGATIYDIFHLPEDEAVARILKENKDLQNVTLGRWQQVVAEVEKEYARAAMSATLVNSPFIGD